MPGIVFFLWLSIVLSGVALLGYSIWNLIVVWRDFSRIAQEAKK